MTFHDFCEQFKIDPGSLAQLVQEAYKLYLQEEKLKEEYGDEYETDHGSYREVALWYFLQLLTGECD
jgi:hypothetical protein